MFAAGQRALAAGPTPLQRSAPTMSAQVQQPTIGSARHQHQQQQLASTRSSSKQAPAPNHLFIQPSALTMSGAELVSGDAQSRPEALVRDTLSLIEGEHDPEKLVKYAVIWEGVAVNASHIARTAVEKLRSLGWKIAKYSHSADSKAKRALLHQLLSKEYTEASSDSITKYATNFAEYLNMSDIEFQKVSSICITKKYMKSRAFSAIEAAPKAIIHVYSSTEENSSKVGIGTNTHAHARARAAKTIKRNGLLTLL